MPIGGIDFAYVRIKIAGSEVAAMPLLFIMFVLGMYIAWDIGHTFRS